MKTIFVLNTSNYIILLTGEFILQIIQSISPTIHLMERDDHVKTKKNIIMI